VVLGCGAGLAAWFLLWPIVIGGSDWLSRLDVHMSNWVLLLPLLIGGALIGGLGALFATARVVSPETIA